VAQDEDQAAILEELFVQSVISWRQRYPALETPIGNLEAVNRGP
jgi:hypothetical protein